MNSSEGLIFSSYDGKEQAVQPVGIIGAILVALADVDQSVAIEHVELKRRAFDWLEDQAPGASSLVDDQAWTDALGSLADLTPRAHFEDNHAYLDGDLQALWGDLHSDK